MGTSLLNTTPQNTYPSLIKLGDNLPLSGTLKVLSDGNGNDSVLALSTTSLQIGGTTGATWDNTNKRFGIGTDTPASPLSIVNTIALAAGATNPRIENIAYTINNTGAQTGTATGIFLNATETNLNGQTHNLMDLQVGGVSRFSVNKDGAVRLLQAVFTGKIYASSLGIIGDSIGLLLRDASESSFGRLQFGGTTSSFPAIKRNGTAIDFRLADDSGFCNISAGNIISSNLISGTTASGVNACFNNYRDNSFTTTWLTIDNTTAKANFKTAWNQTGLPTTRPATVGDIYIDTAANITANGDKFLAIRQ
jgi:hypothetical protein